MSQVDNLEKKAGGRAALAQAAECTPHAVSNWKARGGRVPTTDCLIRIRRNLEIRGVSLTLDDLVPIHEPTNDNNNGEEAAPCP